MPSPKRRPNEISAGGVVYRRRQQEVEVCIIRAGKYWGIPKGHVEAGETAHEAALREISEETGLPRAELNIRAELPASEYVYRRNNQVFFKFVHHFLVEAPNSAELHPQETEVQEALWLNFDAALKRVTFDDTKTALQEARRILNPA